MLNDNCVCLSFFDGVRVGNCPGKLVMIEVMVADGI